MKLESGPWISFDDRWPNESAARGYPSVKTTDAVLCTNNLSSRDRMGRMSRVWFVTPRKSSSHPGEVIAFDACDRCIRGLTHWLDFDALCLTPPSDNDGEREA